jgi:hypothetical protein
MFRKSFAAALPAALCAVLFSFVLAATPAWSADVDPAEADFELTIRQGDTLIGIGKRLLVDPNRWPEVQRRNSIPDPNRLAPGSTMLIPRPLLRLDAAEMEVRAVVGEATKADGSPVAVGERLREGSAIRTADSGFVTVQLVDGSTMQVKPRTDMKVERVRRVAGTNVTDTQLDMSTGTAEVRFKPAVPKVSRFQIRTGFATAAVRGTEFRVTAQEKGTRTEVSEGTIAFTGLPAGGAAPTAADTVAVPDGFGSFVDETRKPSQPVALLAAPALPRPFIVQVAPNFRLRLPRITGAVTYRATLATDADMQQIRYEQVFTTPDIAFANLEPGNYTLQVRAIDKSGLEGRDGRVPVNLRPPKPAAPPAPAASDGASAPAAPAAPFVTPVTPVAPPTPAAAPFVTPVTPVAPPTPAAAPAARS